MQRLPTIIDLVPRDLVSRSAVENSVRYPASIVILLSP